MGQDDQEAWRAGLLAAAGQGGLYGADAGRSAEHERIVRLPRVRIRARDNLDLLAHGRTVEVVPRSVHYHVCRAARSNRSDCDTAPDTHHTQRSIVDGRNLYGGNLGE